MLSDTLLSLSFPLASVLVPSAVAGLLSFVYLLLSRLTSPQDEKEQQLQYKNLPGPKGIPWVGPILSLPTTRVYQKFKEWVSDELSPVEISRQLNNGTARRIWSNL